MRINYLVKPNQAKMYSKDYKLCNQNLLQIIIQKKVLVHNH